MWVIFICDEEHSFGGGFRSTVRHRYEIKEQGFVAKGIPHPSRMIQLQLVKTSPIGTLAPSRGGNVSLRKSGSCLAAIGNKLFNNGPYGEHSWDLPSISRTSSCTFGALIVEMGWKTKLFFLISDPWFEPSFLRVCNKVPEHMTRNGARPVTDRIEQHYSNGIVWADNHFSFLYLHGGFESSQQIACLYVFVLGILLKLVHGLRAIYRKEDNVPFPFVPLSECERHALSGTTHHNLLRSPAALRRPRRRFCSSLRTTPFCR